MPLPTITTKLNSFFDKNFKTPNFIIEKEKQQQQLSRRGLLKSAAGIAAISTLPSFHLAANEIDNLAKLTKTDPWLTLHATLNHLLPKSANNAESTEAKSTDAKNISAQSINALAYLHQIMTVQPTEQDEKDFILKGVGWLNSYANSEKDKSFVELNLDDKERLLRGISKSRAGENWLNTLIGYIFQAMLAPPSYGGNTNGIGWQWLEHQAGFPLPEKGQRYFELPQRAKAIKINRSDSISIKTTTIKTAASNTTEIKTNTIKHLSPTRNHKA
jgi:gluconate 2-dehydrogenase gamma chain